MLKKRKVHERVNSRGLMGMSYSEQSRAIFYCDYFGKEFGILPLDSMEPKNLFKLKESPAGVDANSDGSKVYFTSVGTQNNQFHDGKLHEYDVATGTSKILLEDLHYPGAVVVTRRNIIYFAERSAGSTSFGGRGNISTLAFDEDGKPCRKTFLDNVRSQGIAVLTSSIQHSESVKVMEQTILGEHPYLCQTIVDFIMEDTLLAASFSGGCSPGTGGYVQVFNVDTGEKMKVICDIAAGDDIAYDDERDILVTVGFADGRAPSLTITPNFALNLRDGKKMSSIAYADELNNNCCAIVGNDVYFSSGREKNAVWKLPNVL